MFEVRSEAHGRVLSAIEDIKSCCEIGDYYEEWSDIVASSIQVFLEDLSAEQLDDTCGAFREYISENAEENPNLANGIKKALTICLNEMLDYIGDVPDYDGEDEDYYSNYDRETADLVSEIKSAVRQLVTVKPTTATPNTTPLPVCTDRGIYHFKSTFQGKIGLSDDSNLKK